ncbi:hypothetical protein IJH06_00810 [Candidatus Saccharibacteria bacterium]|nr:hypothetical protein [Candidatus Saccharibacteria bacterium]
MKKGVLKLKIGLSFLGLGFLVAAITVAVTPWSVFNVNSYTGIRDSRFYITGDYDKSSKTYQDAVYKKLTSGDEHEDADDEPSEAAKEAMGVEKNVSNAHSGEIKSDTSSRMSGIVIAEADGSPYTRSDYGTGWDVSGLDCSIRATILKQTSTIEVQTASNGCTVTYGSWVDPYSGATLTGNPYQGDGTANDLDIDHIIPLKYVNAHGGYSWNSNAKVAYGKSVTAMDNGVYLAVSASENRKKSDSGPADYYPSNPDFYCEYSKRWRDVARIYNISMSERDYNKVQGVLVECGIN